MLKMTLNLRLYQPLGRLGALRISLQLKAYRLSLGLGCICLIIEPKSISNTMISPPESPQLYVQQRH